VTSGAAQFSHKIWVVDSWKLPKKCLWFEDVDSFVHSMLPSAHQVLVLHHLILQWCMVGQCLHFHECPWSSIKSQMQDALSPYPLLISIPDVIMTSTNYNPYWICEMAGTSKYFFIQWWKLSISGSLTPTVWMALCKYKITQHWMCPIGTQNNLSFSSGSF
jgi:hypothetical protein